MSYLRTGLDSSVNEDDEMYAVRPNAPISVVKAAKASLKEPTRPMTPSDAGRQLFSRESDFAQNRPPSSYGLPGSKMFFKTGPKLNIAKLDPYASMRADAGSLSTRRSILETSSSLTSYEGLAAAAAGSSRGLQRNSSQGLRRSTSVDPWSPGPGPAAQQDELLLQHQVSGGRPTAAETVQALKASLAAVELGYKSPHELCDIGEFGVTDRVSGSSRSMSRGHHGAAAAAGGPEGSAVRASTMFEGITGAQVLDLAQLQYSDSSDYDDDDDDDKDYYQDYDRDSAPSQRPSTSSARNRPSATSGQPGTSSMNDSRSAAPAHCTGDIGTPSKERASSSSSTRKEQQQQQRHSCVILDDSEEFKQWQQRTEGVLLQVATATAALAAATAAAAASSTQQQSSTFITTSVGIASQPGQAHGAVDRKAALAQLIEQCGHLMSCAVEVRSQQAKASLWLNSSSQDYRDSHGKPLTMREAISEHLFRLMDSSSPELLLKACSVALRVVRSRPPLLQAGKLLYRLSKDNTNDALFRREALFEPMLRTIHVLLASATKSSSTSTSDRKQQQGNMYEPLVYYCGTLKNVSNDAQNQKALVKCGAVTVMCTALSSIADVTMVLKESQQEQQAGGSSSSGSSATGSSQVAVQVTGVLRNLAVAPAHAVAFLASGGLESLQKAMSCLGHQQELGLNLGRILSKLSLNDQCQAAMESEPELLPEIVRLLSGHAGQPALLLRLAFVLGNLTTSSDTCRWQVATVPGFQDLVITAVTAYAAGQPPQVNNAVLKDDTPTTAASSSSNLIKQASHKRSMAASYTDCTVKLLRLVANLAIHPKIGPGLASRQDLADLLLSLLEKHSSSGDAEELVLNAVCAVTNLSFYNITDNKVLALDPGRLIVTILPMLLDKDNEEAVVEAARAYGNLSRQPGARQVLMDCRALDALVLLTDHSSWEVLYSVCGTLINFSSDGSAGRRRKLVELGGHERLMDVLARCKVLDSCSEGTGHEQPHEMQVATLCAVCKALFNLCASSNQAGQQQQPCLTSEQKASLAALLQDIRSCGVLMKQKEVPQVTQRLLALL